MKTIKKKNYIRLLFACLFVFVAVNMQAQINVQLQAGGGSCLSDCSITVTATGTTGSVTYSLMNYPAAGQNTPPQSSNVFSALPPGTYMVGVYDDTTGGQAVTASVTLTSSYTRIAMNAPVSSYTPSLCGGYTGTLRLSFAGGKAPYRMKIINRSAPGNTVEVWTSKRDTTFANLPSGNYGFELQDDCDQMQVSANDIAVGQASNQYNFNGVNITKIEMATPWAFTIRNDCEDLGLTTNYNGIIITTNGSMGSFNLNDNQVPQLQFRIEYPALSGNYTDWVPTSYTASPNNHHLSNTIAGYDRSQPNGDKYRLQILHPCTGAITSSEVYTLPPESFRTINTVADYCSLNSIRVEVPNLVSSSWISGFQCKYYPYTIVLKQGDAIIATKTLNTGGTYVDFTTADGLVAGYYDIEITGGNGYSDVLSNVYASSSTLSSKVTFVVDYDYFQIPSHQCRDAFTISVYSTMEYPGQPAVRYSIEATPGSGTPPITMEELSLPLAQGHILLWEVPFGSYDVTADFGCGTVTQTVSKTKPIMGLEANLTAEDAGVCGRYNLIADGYFLQYPNGNRWETANYMRENQYTVVIEDGPAGAPTGYQSPYGNSGQPNAVFDNLPGGTYTIAFWPYTIPSSYQTINGRNIYYPTDHNTCYLIRKTIVLPEYVYPALDIPYSGGISCSNGMTTMTVTPIPGSNPPYTYRYKAQGAPDASYFPQAFQTGNTFSNVTPGYYTVQIKDDCGSITTQDVRVFNGNEQFVGIQGETSPGVVCETNEVVLGVLSIGPVKWYRWHFRVDDTQPWEQIGTDSPTYIINNVNQGHIGEYRVTIDNGNCELTSAIKIVRVAPPAGTPTISGASTFCTGSNTTLTATTTATSPIYRWYKDGVEMANSNSRTRTVNEPGAYTVQVIPSGGCPSGMSAAHNVTEGMPQAPVITGSQVIFCTSGAVLTASPQIANATYSWYKDGSSTAIHTGAANTYSATAGGSYRVTVSYGGASCVSPLSSSFSVTADIINPTDYRAYVTVTGSGTKDGSSWANAHSSLADVLMAAQTCSNIYEVWVGAGVYHPAYNPVDGSADNRDKTFLMPTSIQIYGGFPANPVDDVDKVEKVYDDDTWELVEVIDTRKPLDDPTPDLSILSGDLNKNGSIDNSDAYHVVVNAGGYPRLDGLVISGGNANGSGLATIKGRNIPRSSGGGAINIGPYGYLMAQKVIFRNNSATERGGAIYSENTTNYINNAVFHNNRSSEGGAIANDVSSTLWLTNALMRHNTAGSNGGAISNHYGSTTSIVNATITENTASVSSHGIYNNAGDLKIHNSIVVRNSSSFTDVANTNSGTMEYKYSVLGGRDAGVIGDHNLNGLLSANFPTFVSATDYRLATGSKGINAGNNDLYYDSHYSHYAFEGYENLDLAEGERIKGSAIDMGAYEDPYGGGVQVDITVFLHGPLQSNGTMTTYIQTPHAENSVFTASRLSTTDPYGLSVSCPDINDANKVGQVVDWVRMEIRKQSNRSQVVEAKALFLRPNGKIVDIDGSAPIFLPIDEPVHVIVRHRSHLSVATPVIPTLTESFTYDFSTALTQAYKNEAGDPAPMMRPYSDRNIWCMWAGSIFGNDEITNNLDLSYFLPYLGGQDTYTPADLDMNGIINAWDENRIRTTESQGIYSPLLSW